MDDTGLRICNVRCLRFKGPDILIIFFRDARLIRVEDEQSSVIFSLQTNFYTVGEIYNDSEIKEIKSDSNQLIPDIGR